MQQIVLLLIGAHLSYAGIHSLKYFFTGVSGDIDFPEFTAIGIVDGEQFYYYDSNKMKSVPKTEWIRQNEGADYWDRQTQLAIGYHQVYKVDFQTLKERFNQSQGIHTIQEMYGCEWDDETRATNGFYQDSYDGEDFVYLDLKEMRYISPVPQALLTLQKWNDDKAFLAQQINYLSIECIEWLQKYMQYGKSSLEKTVSPQVSLLQKSSSSPVVCHATGFYPSGIKISWQKNGQDHDEDVELEELLPNEDGTFQKSSTLTVTPEEWKNNKFRCVVEHQGKTKTEKEIRTNEVSVPFGIIIAVIAVVLLIAIGITGYMVWKKKQGFKPVSGSDDGSNSSTHAVPQA
uniref:major histocompatibility complex class I UDA precursor n=1 Tax=Danio rerio TaxID=7955 RepID=UPI0000EA2FEE|nr:major histocompatibility complex class I UDA precursor [Danio rerio]AAI28863.1 Major histocompatibility complex class I UDA gene [Danio rerio]